METRDCLRPVPAFLGGMETRDRHRSSTRRSGRQNAEQHDRQRREDVNAKTGKHRKRRQQDERNARHTHGDRVVVVANKTGNVSGLDKRRGLGLINVASPLIRKQDVQDLAMLADHMSAVLTIDERGWPSTRKPSNPPIKPEHSRQRGQERSQEAVTRGKITTAGPYFAKVWMYSNSRLPSRLPPLQLHVPDYPLLCLAARHSLAVYDSCGKNEHPDNNSTRPARPGSINLCIPASRRHATKAMTITSTTHDTTAHIILAIRGSSSLLDWATTNALHVPVAPPAHFLPDQGNLVHAGFLHAALAMVSPIATHLRALLEEKPERCSHSLTLTGHSAGGSIAALLYAHIISLDYGTTSSPLKTTAAAFRRIHCITFGAPPVSLLPLSKPTPYPDMPREESKKLRRSLFMAFVNEGDPIVRADFAVLKSLMSLYTTPAPSPGTSVAWPIPPGALSCAGSLILLRHSSSYNNSNRQTGAVPAKPEKAIRTGLAALLNQSRPIAAAMTTAATGNLTAPVTANRVLASQITDGQLRDRVFGDPGVHGMAIYRERVEALAFGAVTARSAGGRG